jgi:hypothetical protein
MLISDLMFLVETWAHESQDRAKFRKSANIFGGVIMCLNALFAFPILGSIFGVILNIDPSRRFFARLSVNFGNDRAFLIFAIRMVQNLVVWYEIWRMSASILIAVLFMVSIFRLLVSELRVKISNRNALLDFISDSHFQKIRRNDLLKRIRLHNWMTILETIIHDVADILGPFLALFGIFILMVCNYGTIRMYGRISIPIYGIFPTVSVVAFGALVVILPNMCQINEDSIDFLRRLTLMAHGKYERKVLKAVRALRINVGSYFYANRSLKIKYLEVVAYYTINALLLS